MKRKDLLIDYSGFILLKAFGFMIRLLPVPAAFSIGSAMGRLYYYFDLRHRAVVYSNIRKAFAERLNPGDLKKIARDFYSNFFQSIIEVFLIPAFDDKYFKDYVSVEGLSYAKQAHARGKGVIFLAVHEGSWEMSNFIFSILNFPFSIFMQDLRYPKINGLLNKYRRDKDYRTIQRENQIRHLIKIFKDNGAVGMTLDQGGKAGESVDFFGKTASMSSGPVRLALKYDAAVVPSYYIRESGPRIKLLLEPVFELTRSKDEQKDIADNLARLVKIYEKNISRFPKEYLWTYKTWKYSKQRNILVLSDSRPGHLSQSNAAADLLTDALISKGIEAQREAIEVKFKNRFSKLIFAIISMFAGKYSFLGSGLFEALLDSRCYQRLIRLKPDIIISCGSSLAGVNYLFSRENQAKAVTIMKPSLLSLKKFDLAILPFHDRPKSAENVVVCECALNSITENRLNGARNRFLGLSGVSLKQGTPVIGVLLGGDAGRFKLDEAVASRVISQLRLAAGELGADILITTSRRTPQAVERLIKDGISKDPCCKLAVIANESNIPGAVEGILSLSDIVVVSPESISMISEALMSAKKVLVFDGDNLKKRHRRFLLNCVEKKYIKLVDSKGVKEGVIGLVRSADKASAPQDNIKVKSALSRLL